MFWRSQSRKAWNEMRGAGAQRAFRKLVQNGKASGVLAFVEDEPVGWCSFGPRSDFPVLETVRAYRLSPSFAWTGPLTIFEELSFKRVVDSNPLKPVVRLRLKKLFEHFWGAVAAD